MGKYYVIDKLSLEAGPQFGFLMSAKETFTDQDTNETITDNVKDGYKTLDFGFNIGGGYDFTEKFSVGLRYNIGLSNILKSQGEDIFEAKNRVLSLSAQYKF